ncbi:MAG: response regulator [Betaproteobacteria bacterium]|nr:MAG: response regulator [Betaproteobacteria bacterium]
MSTILVVDDMPANLDVVTRHLEQHGYQVIVAQDGEEAIDPGGLHDRAG